MQKMKMEAQRMDKIRKHPNGWMLTLGVLFMMVSVALGGYVVYRYADDLDVGELVFDTWLNEKRDLFEDLRNIQAPVDDKGNPMYDDTITRSGGGYLEWSTPLFEAEGEPLSSPALVDLNNDGTLEIVVASAGDYVYALGPQGTYYWSDPYSDDVIDYLGQTPQTSGLDFDPPHIFASVIAADVNLGDTPEVIIGVKDGALCLGADGQKQWKKGLTSGYYFSTACITDLEGEWTGNKEDLEIVLASDDESRSGWIEAFEVDGGAVFRESAPTGGEGGLIGCSVVAHDLDGDFWNGPELISPDPSKERDTELIIGNHDRALRIWVRQGENSEGKPNYDESTSGWLGGHQTYATTAVANVTGTPECEIFVGCSEGYPRTWTGWGGKLYVYTPSGKKLWDYSTGSSRASIFSSPAIADMQVAKDDPEEKHLDYEIVFGCDNGNMYVMNTEFHSVLWSFNTGGRCMSSPAICNIDNDDELEIVIGSDSGKVYCFDGDPSDGIDEGIPYAGDGPSQDVLWVYDAKSPIGISSPVVADIDLDGQLEVVIGDQEGHVHCISAGGRSVTGQADWTEFHCDLNRTGFYNPQTSYGVDLYPRTYEDGRSESLVKSIQPGQTIIYNMTVENTGKGITEVNKDKINVKLDPNSVPKGWKATLKLPEYQGIPNPDFVMLASEETAPVELKVTAPWEGDIGEMARINVTANSTTDKWASDTATTLSILDLFVDFELSYLKQPSVDPLDPLVGKKWDKINPGGEVIYTVSILNKGNLNDTYEVSLNPPPADTGWNWTFIETSSLKARIDLAAPIFREVTGATSGTTLNVKVKCPIDARKDTQLPVVVRGISVLSGQSDIEEITKTDEITMVVGEHNELEVRIDESTKYVDPNGTVEFMVSITNLGNKDVINVKLSVYPKAAGWDVRYPDDPIPVFHGQTKKVAVTIKAPGYARANSKLVLNVEGVIVDATNFVSTAPLTVIVNHVYDFDADVIEKEGVAVDPGTSVYFNIQISNLGNGDDLIKPTAYEIMLDWNLTFFNQEGYQKYEVPLEYKATYFLLGRIKVPEDTRTQRYVVGVNLTGGGSTKVVYIAIFVNQTFDLRVTSEEEYNMVEEVYLQPNQEKPFIIKVANYGNGRENVVLKLGQDYDPETDAMTGLYQGWEGKFVAVANTPDFTQNIRPYDFREIIPVSNIGADVYYTPNYTVAGGSADELREITLQLDKGMVAWVHMTLKAPENEVGGQANPVIVSGRGIGGEVDWNAVTFNVTVLFPDLEFVDRIRFSGGSAGGSYDAVVGDVVTIQVNIKNSGDIPAENVDVQLLIDGVEKKVTTLRTIKNISGDEKTVIFSWVAESGEHEVKVVIDPENTVIESRDQFQHGGQGDNNVIKRTINVEGGNLVVEVVNEYPVVSTLLIMLLLVVILVGVAIYLKSKKVI